MSSSETPIQLSPSTASSKPEEAGSVNPGAEIDYSYFLDCVHCGLCTAACPTYVELGNENDSPHTKFCRAPQVPYFPQIGVLTFFCSFNQMDMLVGD